MCIALALKIFSDCCVGFAILGAGPVSFRIPLLVPALICGTAAGIAVFFCEKNWNALSRLCGLLPLLCLLLAENGQQTLILLIPAAYTALVIFRGKLELEYYSYRRFLIQSLVLLGASYLIANIWVFLSTVTGDPVPELHSNVILRYGLVHLLCGVMLQRQLRLGIGRRSEGGRRQMSMLLGTVVVVIVAFVAAEPMLRQYAAVLMQYAMTILVTPIMLLVELLSWIISLFEKKQPEQPVTDATADVSSEGAVSVGNSAIQQVTQQLQEKTEDPNLIWLVLAVIFLAVVAVIMRRSFQKGHGSAASGENEGKILTAAGIKKPAALTNRARVRQLYREFLRVEQGWGLKLKCCDTSGDILDRIHPETDKLSASELRHVYLIARYDNRKQVSRSQLNLAKQALKGTHKGKR